MKDYKCGHCGKEFRDYESNRTKSKTGKFFCSRECKGLASRKTETPVRKFLRCVKCKKRKSVAAFYSDKKCRANGGYQYACKECTRTERNKHYDLNRERIMSRVRAYQAELPAGQKRKNQTKRTSEQRKANAALNRAVNSGKIKKPNRCEKCGSRRKLHGHHESYDQKNWLRVIWLCIPCHHEAHGRGPATRRSITRT